MTVIKCQLLKSRKTVLNLTELIHSSGLYFICHLTCNHCISKKAVTMVTRSKQKIARQLSHRTPSPSRDLVGNRLNIYGIIHERVSEKSPYKENSIIAHNIKFEKDASNFDVASRIWICETFFNTASENMLNPKGFIEESIPFIGHTAKIRH